MRNKVCMYLPPFAGDYSGVCSALFDLGGMICIHDAAGCTGNYTHFDEPRWFGSEAMVYCTSLRKMDAILGDDEKFINRIINHAKENNPKFIAIVGSPVPNVIGFDFNGVAKSIENRTGIPSFGFATAGIKGSYKDGLVMASIALLKYYESNPDKREEISEGKYVAIPGISPLDISQDIYEKLQSIVTDTEVNLIESVGDYGSLAYLQNPEKIALNLVFNQAGLEVAKYMEEKYKTPYIMGIPVGENAIADYKKLINAVISESSHESFLGKIYETPDSRKKGLIMADGVVGLSIRSYLRKQGLDADVVSISGKIDEAYYASGEDEIVEWINGDYEFVIADSLVLELVETEALKIVLPHYAVSSRVRKDENWDFLSDTNWEVRLQGMVTKANKKLA